MMHDDMAPKIAPSILAADFWALGAAIQSVAEHSAMIHVDVMDGRFVPNITMGNVVIEAIKAHSDLFIDCHLMAIEPSKHFASLAKSGADSISFHYEASEDPDEDLRALSDLGIAASIAISPPTSDEVLIPYLEMADMIVVMSVNPGFSGQKFIDSAIGKIERLRRRREDLGLGFEIEVDGGITEKNIEKAAEAGATVFVSASAIFGGEDPGEAAAKLEQLAALGMSRCPYGASIGHRKSDHDNLVGRRG